MHPLNVILLLAGAGLIAFAALRARPRWARYRNLQDQAANVARYEAWRGGVRDSAPTGASVAIAMLRRELGISVLIALVGLGLLIAGLLPS